MDEIDEIFNPLHVTKEPLRDERSRTRPKFKPKTVKYLFVGESVPSGGTFFYFKNSILFEHTLTAFKKVYPEITQVTFLDRFKEMGFYLDDLCSEPVDDKEEKIRKYLCKLYEEDLLLRIKEHNPQLIIVTPKRILENIKKVLRRTELDIPLIELPFPTRSKSNVDNYVNGLIEILNEISASEDALLIYTFWKYGSSGGDTYELKITGKDEIYLLHTASDGNLVTDNIVNGESDEARITNGILKIDEIKSNLLEIDPVIKSALEGLENARKKMR